MSDKPTMQPLSRLSRTAARQVRAVFTDIDDTITHAGRVEAKAFAAMWNLHQAGIAVVPVTGRPAGWCDHIARMWPVAGVVGENGAFYYRYDEDNKQLVRRFVQTDAERSENQKRLRAVKKRILRAVPGAALASDQAFRLHDLAIDYCEDVPRLPDEAVMRIVDIFQAAGATAKVSSIHVNGWFGHYDKLGMIKRFAREVLGLRMSRSEDNRRTIYVGDSPNDEPAFAFFTNGVGVANVRAFTEQMRHLPAFVTSKPGGEGFAQAARRLLATRAKRT